MFIVLTTNRNIEWNAYFDMYFVKIRKKYISYICKGAVLVLLLVYLCIIHYYICDPGPQTSRKAQFYEIEIYTSSKSWINKLSIDVWFVFGRDTTIWKSGIWGRKKNRNIEKIAFKVVQMKFLAKHITYQKLSFDIFSVGNVLNIFIEHDLCLVS